jgi:hypothetical protein
LYKKDNGSFTDTGESIPIYADSLVHYRDTHPMNIIRIMERNER